MPRFGRLGLVFVCFLAGCVSLHTPAYINRADHPYTREFYAGFEKVTESVIYVLKKRGWAVAEEAEPSLYERDVRYENNGYQNLLVMTVPRRSNHLVTSTFSRLNVFIHSLGNTTQVEIRYEAITPFIKHWTSVRNDRLGQRLLDAMGDEISK